MTAVDDEARGIPAPLYAFLTLPSGLMTGFVTVTLAYVLTHHGVSVGAVAGLVSLCLLPQTWKFIAGPVLDMSLTSPRWYVIAIAAMVASLLGFALVPLEAASVPVLAVLCLTLGIGGSVSGSAQTAAMAAITPNSKRGAVAGWGQTGNLGGIGVSGGLGLWLTIHAGGPRVAVMAMIVICVASAWPLLLMRVPRRPPGLPLKTQALTLGHSLMTFARTRQGVLATVAVTIPAGLGAAGNLLPAAADDWKASADMVALVTGVLGGLATMPGCLLAGYLADRYHRRTVFISSCVAYAGGEIAMALAPHTPGAFASFVLLNALLQGVAWGAVSALIFECLGRTGAATLNTALSSLCNVPVVTVVALLGWTQTYHGSTAMLLTEAGLGIISVIGYSLLAWFWKPAVAAPTAALAAAS